jgi:biopolymer transport protein ExbD
MIVNWATLSVMTQFGTLKQQTINFISLIDVCLLIMTTWVTYTHLVNLSTMT